MDAQKAGKINNWNHIDGRLFKTVNIKEKNNIFYPSSIIAFNEYNVVLNFDNEFNTRKAILDFLDTLGFNSTDSGYRYLDYIFNYCVNNNFFPIVVKKIYEICAAACNTNIKNVEIAIISSIKTALACNRLQKMNDVFGCEKVVNDHISNGTFITTVCQRFNLAKEYNKEISFKA